MQSPLAIGLPDVIGSIYRRGTIKASLAGDSTSRVPLTRREREVIALLQATVWARDRRNSWNQLRVTVRNHKASLYRKFQVHCQQDLLDRLNEV